MGIVDSQQLLRLPGTFIRPTRQRLTWRRLLIAGILVLLLHLIFFFGIAPYLQLDHPPPSRTEVTEITPQQLAELKQKVLQKHLTPLLKQELHEEYKTKEAPKDAQMMAPFNQTVPKQKVAGPQPDAPLDGGGGKKPQPIPKKLELNKLGLGNKLPEPRPVQQESTATRQGPPGPFRPVGRDDKSLERGNENLLNAAESEYYSFFERFTEPFVRNWYFLVRSNYQKIGQEVAMRKGSVGMEYPVTIQFVLDREGNFKSIEVARSSGLPTFDWTAKEAVRKLVSLPNPPVGLFEGKSEYVHQITVTLVVTEQPILDSRPDVAW